MTARPPTTAPAIAPVGVLELGFGVGITVGLAMTEGKGCDVCEGAGGLQAGGPMATRFEVVDCWLCDSVNCCLSLSTMRYAELRNGRPKSGISFRLMAWRLLITTSASVELDGYSCPSEFISISGTTSWWFGIVISRPGYIENVRLPSYLGLTLASLSAE